MCPAELGYLREKAVTSDEKKSIESLKGGSDNKKSRSILVQDMRILYEKAREQPRKKHNKQGDNDATESN